MNRFLPVAGMILSVFSLLSCGGGGGSSSPTEPRVDNTVATVSVSPSSTSIEEGQTTQFSATARNASGDVLQDISFSWNVSNTQVASINSNGLARGIAAGEVTVRATAQQRTGTASLEVEPAIVINSVSPGEIVEGQEATIRGRGFSSTAAQNRVTISGVEASVVSASTTELRVTVPSDCQPSGSVQIRVAVGQHSSSPFNHPFRSQFQPFIADVGTTYLANLPSSGELCLLLGGDNARYVLGVQSTSETVSSLTPLKARAYSRSNSSGVSFDRLFGRSLIGNSRSLLTAWRTRHHTLYRHRSAESRLRAQETQYIKRFRPLVGRPTSLQPARVPQVGDQLQIRVPDIAGDVCSEYTQITGVVQHVGREGIFVEDVDNSVGLSASQLEELSDLFDNVIMSELEGTFGRILDLDGNGRVVIVITKELNKTLEQEGALGFVTFPDLVSRAQCPASNMGEYYYGISPDPQGNWGESWSVEEAVSTQKRLIAHEVTHIIQFERRGTFPGATGPMASWQSEGQATLAEELIGYRVHGRAPGNNYGPDVVLEDVDPNWHLPGFLDLFGYFGFGGDGPRVAGAPEQCSFLGGESEGNNGPCMGRMPYGVAWSFLRWLSDQVGQANTASLQRGIIESRSTGFKTIEDLVGVPRKDLLLHWAIALYADDRSPSLNPISEFSSWNLFAINEGVRKEARLQPYMADATVGDRNISVRAGSSAYFEFPGSPGSFTLESAGGGSIPPEIQVWLVRLQ